MEGPIKQPVIAIEEHYLDHRLEINFAQADALLPTHLRQSLEDLGALRIKAMDDAGIDVQVLSHAGPATQRTDPENAIRLSRAANDRLYEAIRLNPNRFSGFATLPTPAPKAAADELERAVVRLGFVGGMINGLTHGRFIDEKQYWPIFERAQALDVPLYMHPAVPHPTVIESYYKDYVAQYPNLLGAACGFTVEGAVQAIRLVLSGVLEAFPGIKIILGHLGEGLPYLLWRIDHALSRPGNLEGSFRDCFCKHFYVTTSGHFSDPALICCAMELGIDRILFAVDWPFVSSRHRRALGKKHSRVCRRSGQDSIRERKAPVADLIRNCDPNAAYRPASQRLLLGQERTLNVSARGPLLTHLGPWVVSTFPTLSGLSGGLRFSGYPQGNYCHLKESLHEPLSNGSSAPN